MYLIKNAAAFFLLLLLTPAILGDPLRAETKTPIDVMWARTDFAPYFIVKGEHQGKGISDQIIVHLTKKISIVKHHPVNMSLKRMLKNARSGVAICHVALLRTPERETFIDYSLPIMKSYPNGIITTAKGLEKFGLTPKTIAPLNLEKLIDKNLSISVHDGRSYSPYIDNIIKQELSKKHSIFRVKTGLKEHERLVLMMANNRLDGLIARPEEVQFINIDQKLDQTLYFVKIIDNSSTDFSHVGCSKGDWNKELIKQINTLIEEDEVLIKTINDAQNKWLPTHLHSSHIFH
ncbi:MULTISPECIES: transporter substrate-binding domain-containing protein [unclassified Neptuniibacter]|uniref:transporter substrate-binding domain-containing protein n=1 Tax=unclassified Neptuniibacter TaxID=2630693 RepID=UPI000C645627|nr:MULTISPECIES: transporter substrate-binding domain-containing protein [unclassified Neptuniibacter]MAY42757.1 hypothetical protein [Oceanospirillaceae bacterium]|tara:strand:+ start:10510 stop:11382 length:873 start_codon:yes stop_codon:yes gene_type:complete